MDVGPVPDADLEDAHALHLARLAKRGGQPMPAARAPEEYRLIGKANWREWTTCDQVKQWLAENPFCPTYTSVYEDTLVLRKWVELLPEDDAFKKRYDFATCAGKTPVENSLHLLSTIQVMYDLSQAMRGSVGSRSVAAPDAIHPIPKSTKKVHERMWEAKPVDWGWLRDTLGLCESPYQIQKLSEWLANERNEAATDMQHGDIALPPLLVAAPARMGKTAINALLAFFARRMGLVSTYGVSPNTHAVADAVLSVFQRLGWWSDDGAGFLGKCVALHRDLGRVGNKATDVSAPRFDFVLYSSDNKLHAQWVRAYVDARAMRLDRKGDLGEDNHAFNGIYYRVSDADRAIGRTCTFAHFRDEAQNSARFGAEKDIDAYEAKDDRCEALVDSYEELCKSEHNNNEPGIAGKREAMRERVEDLKADREKARLKVEKSRDGSQEALRSTFVPSRGAQILISATLVPTTRERQLWGLTFEPEVPEHLDLGQNRTIVYPLGPEVESKDYKGVQDTINVNNWRNGTAFTRTLVRQETVRLFQRRCQAQMDYLSDMRAERTAELNSLALEDGEIDQVGLESLIERICEQICDLEQTKQNADVVVVPPACDPLFEGAMLGAKPGLLNMDGGVFLCRGEPVKQTTNVLKQLAASARGTCWLRSIIGNDPKRIRLVKPPLQEKEGKPEAPWRMPITLVCPTNGTAPTCTAIQGPRNRSHQQSAWVEFLLDELVTAKQPGFVALYASGMSEERVRRYIRPGDVEMTFDAGFAVNQAGDKALKQVTVFEVRIVERQAMICPVKAPVTDMAGVVSMVKDTYPNLQRAAAVAIFAVGYDMFNGAITMSHHVSGGWMTYKRREDGLGLCPDRAMPVLVAPANILFAHSAVRGLDQIVQMVGRTYNDLQYKDDQYKISMLSFQRTHGDIVAMSLAEDQFVNVLRVEPGMPEPDEDPLPLPPPAPAPPRPREIEYDDEGIAIVRAPEPPPLVVVDARPRKRVFGYEAMQAVHRCFLDPEQLAGDVKLEHRDDLSRLFVGRKRQSVAKTVSDAEPMELERLRNLGGYQLVPGKWKPQARVRKDPVAAAAQPPIVVGMDPADAPPSDDEPEFQLDVVYTSPMKNPLAYNNLRSVVETGLANFTLSESTKEDYSRTLLGGAQDWGLLGFVDKLENAHLFRWDQHMPDNLRVKDWYNKSGIWQRILYDFRHDLTIHGAVLNRKNFYSALHKMTQILAKVPNANLRAVICNNHRNDFGNMDDDN